MPAMVNWSEGLATDLEEFARMLEEATREHAGGTVEGYVRRSTVARLDLDASSGETRWKLGREQGAALRWFDPRDRTARFAAATGSPARAAELCRRIGRKIPGQTVDRCPWNLDAEPCRDLEPLPRWPEQAELASWLRETAPEGLDRAWVECGTVCEAWATEPTKVQVRSRNRAWAGWMPLDDPPAARPLIRAARGWADLARSDPREAWRQRRIGDPSDHPWPDDALWIFSPEISATLVQLLARVAHGPRADRSGPVGPGWVLAAGGKEGLHGVVSDDAGYPSVSRVLADGRGRLARWDGPGSWRRASFRDYPASTPATLTLSPPRLEPPKRAVWITRAEVHPSGDEWLLRLGGRRFPDGVGFRPCWRRVRPSRLLEACLGGVGRAQESHLGVVTPALALDGLLVG